MVSQRLRQLRRSRGFTLDQLSEVSGVNRGTIHRIELDQVSPRLDTLELLCRALGTDLPGFFGQGGTENGLAAPGVDEAPVAGPARDFRQGVLDWLGHLEALFHHSADGFAVTDPGGYISFESQVAMRLRGDTPAGRSGRPWYHTAHPEDQPALVAGMAAVLQRPGETLRLEYRAPVGDGRWRWIRATLRNQVDHPAIRGIVLNLQDITDWKATEAQRWRIQKLESQLQVVKAMTAEFSNLWMGLQGHLDVVRLEGGDANGMAGLQSSLDRASRMIHQMRDICGHLAFDLKPVDFNGIVREQAAARAAQPGAGLRVDLDLHPELPALNGDRELLARMVGHLFDHLAATREGAAGRIRLSTTSLQLSPQEVAERFRDQDLERGGTFAVLEIHDPQPPQPAGPDQDPLDHLFAAGVADGMLTLSAAMRTVRDHGGALEEIRHPENGTILRVYFPVPSTTDLGPLAAG
ncbi:MAG TPA: helix-turn-helix domain-containing protein, partial [Holophagaceae bacterium]